MKEEEEEENKRFESPHDALEGNDSRKKKHRCGDHDVNPGI